ncbi:MAG: xanthine dehydrogenase family protein molybdopterin-binding subunit, partial [bacterium]
MDSGTTWIGRSIPQINSPEKVTGKALYTGDLPAHRALVGRVLRSPHPHARIVHVDASKARSLPGVKVVVAGADVPESPYGPIAKEHHILARQKVRYAGEEVAAVAAADDATALEALERIEVEYEPLPAVFDPEEAMKPDAPRVHEGRGNVAREIHIRRGDLQAGFREAAAVHEATYQTSYQSQVYMEPIGTLAEVDASGRLRVWSSTQSIYFTRELIAQALQIPVSHVQVIQPFVGGGFGGKLQEDPNAIIAAFLAKRAGTAVRLANSRLDEFQGGRPRMPSKITLKMGVRKDGTLCAKECRVIGDNGAYSGLAPEIILVTAFRGDNLYRQENLETEAYLVNTNKVPTGAFRGFGTPQIAFAMDESLDALAKEIGMDPVEIRLVNAIRQGETSVHGWYMGSCGLVECLQRAAKGIGWKEKRGKPGEGPKRRGIGIGVGLHVTANRQLADWDGSTAAIKFNEDGKVNLISGEGEMGQGANTVLAQIAAEELGLNLEDIIITAPDTDATPFGFGGFASRLTMLAGNAVRKAAQDARRQLLSIASEQLETSPEDLDVKGGVIFSRAAPNRKMAVAEACRAHIFRRDGEGIYSRGTYDPPTVMADKETFYGNVAPAYSFAVQTVEVEVDVETGRIDVLRLVTADDLGRALNPLACEGQVHGCTAQGLGFALFENLHIEAGQVLNGSLADYLVPKAEGMPEMESILVETID